MNFPKRVPVLANPHEGSSMRNVSRAAKTLSLVDEPMQTSLSDGRLQLDLSRRHGFLWQILVFRRAKYLNNTSREAKTGEGKISILTPGHLDAQPVGAGSRADFAL